MSHRVGGTYPLHPLQYAHSFYMVYRLYFQALASQIKYGDVQALVRHARLVMHVKR
jgi:hypothetical protein